MKSLIAGELIMIAGLACLILALAVDAPIMLAVGGGLIIGGFPIAMSGACRG